MRPFGGMGKSPGQRASQSSPLSRLQQAGINTSTVVADGLLPIGVSAHLRFSFKPIVKVAPIFSVAEFVKLEGTLPNFLFKLLDRFSLLLYFHALRVGLFH